MIITDGTQRFLTFGSSMSHFSTRYPMASPSKGMRKSRGMHRVQINYPTDKIDGEDRHDIITKKTSSYGRKKEGPPDSRVAGRDGVS